MWAVCFSGWWSWCAVTSTGQLAMCHQSWTVKALKLSCHSSASSTSRMKQEVNQEWSTTNKPSSLLCCKQAQIFCNLNPWEKVCYLPLRNIQLHMFYTFWWEIFVLYPLSSCSWCIETILYCISVLTKSHDKQIYFNGQPNHTQIILWETSDVPDWPTGQHRGKMSSGGLFQFAYLPPMMWLVIFF